MSLRIELPESFAARMGDDPHVGLFLSSGSETNAEIVASAGFDWLLIDAEHSPYSLETVQALLRTLAAYPAAPVVRIPANDTALIKQYLDLGAQNLMVPMVHTPQLAQQAVVAMHYPPRGVRGIGAALARSSRYNRVAGYLNNASDSLSLTVQIESGEAVAHAAEIAAVDGVDAVFIGPSDLAASLGHLGEQQHPEVLDAVARVFDAVRAAGKPVGVNAFNVEQAQKYVEAGASFVCVGADVQQLALATSRLVARFKGE